MRFFYDTEFIERPCTIDLISIGVVSEDGLRGFYAISSEFDESKACDWVRANVLSKLRGPRLPLSEIAHKLRIFLNPSEVNPIEMWGYYSAYDHVALSWLFGKMIDLPKGMPMYTRDVKQLADSLGNPELPSKDGYEHNAIADAEWTRNAYLMLTKLSEESFIDRATRLRGYLRDLDEITGLCVEDSEKIDRLYSKVEDAIIKSMAMA